METLLAEVYVAEEMKNVAFKNLISPLNYRGFLESKDFMPKISTL